MVSLGLDSVYVGLIGWISESEEHPPYVVQKQPTWEILNSPFFSLFSVGSGISVFFFSTISFLTVQMVRFFFFFSSIRKMFWSCLYTMGP